MKTFKELFSELHDLDAEIAHDLIAIMIVRYGRDDPRVVAILGVKK